MIKNKFDNRLNLHGHNTSMQRGFSSSSILYTDKKRKGLDSDNWNEYEYKKSKLEKDREMETEVEMEKRIATENTSKNKGKGKAIEDLSEESSALEERGISGYEIAALYNPDRIERSRPLKQEEENQEKESWIQMVSTALTDKNVSLDYAIHLANLQTSESVTMQEVPLLNNYEELRKENTPEEQSSSDSENSPGYTEKREFLGKYLGQDYKGLDALLSDFGSFLSFKKDNKEDDDDDEGDGNNSSSSSSTSGSDGNNNPSGPNPGSADSGAGPSNSSRNCQDESEKFSLFNYLLSFLPKDYDWDKFILDLLSCIIKVLTGDDSEDDHHDDHNEMK